MKALGIAFILLVASCGVSNQPVSATTPIHSPSATSLPGGVGFPPGDSPSAASGTRIASPTLAVSLTAVGRSLSCRLPVIYQDQSGQPERAGFIAFPGGTLTQDRSASSYALFFDRAYSKWLPVWRDAVSPDGKSYAYGEADFSAHHGGKVHVVDVSTGADRVVYTYTSTTIVFTVIDFASEGIYLSGGDSEARSRGLWLFKFDGAPPHLINSTIQAPAIGGGAAWGFDFDAADPNPASGGLESPVNRLLRIDLTTGSITPWLYRPGSDLLLAGFDAAGEPLVLAFREGDSSPEVLLVVKSSATAELLASSGAENTPWPYYVSAIDRHGVWFTGAGGNAGSVWFDSSGSIQLVATVDALSFSVAGGCIP